MSFKLLGGVDYGKLHNVENRVIMYACIKPKHGQNKTWSAEDVIHGNTYELMRGENTCTLQIKGARTRVFSSKCLRNIEESTHFSFASSCFIQHKVTDSPTAMTT
jgi:hypothetical protein